MLLKTGAIALFAAAAFAAGAPPAQAATFLSVGPNALCGSAGCFASSKTFVQTFSASGDIAGLNLDRRLLGANQNSAVKITFYTADGQEVSNWGSYVIAGLNGDVVTLGGPGFNWDASRGDLLVRLDLVTPDKGGGGGGSFGGGGGGGSGGAVLFSAPNDGNGQGVPGGGALDHFGGPPPGLAQGAPPNNPVFAAVVPEPASWALMITGFGAAGALVRRQRRHLRFG